MSRSPILFAWLHQPIIINNIFFIIKHWSVALKSKVKLYGDKPGLALNWFSMKGNARDWYWDSRKVSWCKTWIYWHSRIEENFMDCGKFCWGNVLYLDFLFSPTMLYFGGHIFFWIWTSALKGMGEVAFRWPSRHVQQHFHSYSFMWEWVTWL